MMVKSKNFYESFCAVKEQLRTREVSLKKRHYVIVPDKCSLYAERFLFGETGAFDGEVLTFGRLFLKLCDPAPEFLPRAGAIMMIREIVSEHKKLFQAFGRAAEFVGLSEKLYDAICAASAAGLSPSDLGGIGGAAGLKLADIQLVYRTYLERIQGRFVDAFGRTSLLAKTLAHSAAACPDFLKHASFYVVGFDRFTATEQDVLRLLQAHAGAYTLFEVDEPAYEFGDVELYNSPALADRVEQIAARIRCEIIEGAASGLRYRDLCVLAPQEATLAISRIFTEYEIPFFVDEKHDLSESELFRYIKLCASLKDSCRTDTMIQLSKNLYAGIEKSCADAFEEYVIKHGIAYNMFCEPFVQRGAHVAERVRCTLMAQRDAFLQGLQQANSPHAFLKFICDVLGWVDADARTAELSAACGSDRSQIVKMLRETAELIGVSALRSTSPQALFQLFCEGVSSVQLSFSSRAHDVVVVGGADTFRGGRFKTVYAVSFCDGVLPEVCNSAGLIGGIELDALKAKGLTVPPADSELNAYNLNEVVRLFHLADKLFLAYSKDNGSHISSLYAQLLRGAKSYHETCAVQQRRRQAEDGIAPSDVACKAKALSVLVSTKAQSDDACVQNSVIDALKPLCTGHDALLSGRLDFVPQTKLAAAQQLYLQNTTVSVSEIKTYFTCPYRAFLHYGLRLKRRDSGEYSAMDMGTLFHFAAELFVRKGVFDNAELAMQRVIELMDRLVDAADESQLIQIEQDEKMVIFKESCTETGDSRLERMRPIRQLKQRTPTRYAHACEELKRLAPSIAQLLVSGSFVPYLQEAEFGNVDLPEADLPEADLPEADSPKKNDLSCTLEWNIDGKKISLAGKIDRIDVEKDGKIDVEKDGKMGYVIDYKGGSLANAQFRLSDLYSGCGVQLFLYLKVLKQNGITPIGTFYLPLSIRFNESLDEPRLSGIFRDEDEIVQLFDPLLLVPGHKSTILNAKRNKEDKTGKSRLGKSQHHTDGAGIERLMRYAERVSEKGMREMRGGFIQPSPVTDACKYCDYRVLCGNADGKRMEYRKVSVRLDDFERIEEDA